VAASSSAPTKMEAFAHVNPVLAVVIGHFLAGRPLKLRTILGTLLELASAVVIATAKTNKTTTGSRSKALSGFGRELSAQGGEVFDKL
jgi:drug/metabolite transporter (DMT)-like permease